MVMQALGPVDLDQLAILQDGDPVTHRQRLALVVGDVDDRRAQPLVELAQLDLHVFA